MSGNHPDTGTGKIGGNGNNRRGGASNGTVLLDRQYVWPGDLTEIPDWVYTDETIYQREIERIFHGPHLELRRARGGDSQCRRFHPLECRARRRSSWRAPKDGSINVFENRCVHRAAEFCRELSGNDQGVRLPLSPMDLRPQGQPHRRAVQARRRRQGRHAAELSHRARTACASSTSPPTAAWCSPPIADEHGAVADYLGPEILREFEATFDGRKLKVLGHYRHSLPGNWKLYHENLKDPYHATLLHTFLVTFGLLVAGNRSLMLTDAKRAGTA